MDESKVYHYTSIDTFYNILSGVKDNKICLRATHARFMNDPKEYDYALSVLKASMIEYEEKSDINENRKSDHLFKKDSLFSSLSELGGDPYLLSFSKSVDDLSMWRAYGKDGTGISIGFDLNMLKQYCEGKEIYNTSVIECEYDHDKIMSELITYWCKKYDNFQINESNSETGFDDANLFSSIPRLCFKAKSKSYTIENEWRLCKNEFNDDKIKFHVKGNLIVPFIEHYFDKSIIKKIIIGPSSNNEQVESSLRLFLRKFKYSDDKSFIQRSDISYRLV